jgi:hypothetical protein
MTLKAQREGTPPDSLRLCAFADRADAVACGDKICQLAYRFLANCSFFGLPGRSWP